MERRLGLSALCGADANIIVARTLPLARSIENLGSRSAALMLLFQAVLPYDRDIWRPVLDELIDASEPVLNWRQRRNFRDVFQLLLGKDRALAHDLMDSVSDQALRAIADKAIKVGASAAPRPFFWKHDG